MPSGEQIQAALTAFVAKWRGYTGSEKSEAQTFLNDLFACYGSDRRELGARFEHFAPAAGFMDLFWPGVCIITCNFHRFDIREPGRFPNRAIAAFDLDELPDRYDVLALLAGPTIEASFTEHYRELTKDAGRSWRRSSTPSTTVLRRRAPS